MARSLRIFGQDFSAGKLQLFVLTAFALTLQMNKVKASRLL